MSALLGFTFGLALAIAVAMSGVTLSQHADAAEQWARANMLTHELGECRLKHYILLKQIRREGLWRRLGLPGQPWLQ